VLYSFCSQQNCTDGQNPNPALIDVNGILYGVTIAGGTSNCDCGTVFSLDSKTGTETVLHSFGDGADGQAPEASLIAVNGILYGTTENGGGQAVAAGVAGQFSLSTRTPTKRKCFIPFAVNRIAPTAQTHSPVCSP
jgi:uncharacterized repeat protein (TIGR03803 family)